MTGSQEDEVCAGHPLTQLVVDSRKNLSEDAPRLGKILGRQINLTEGYEPPVFDKPQSVRDFLQTSLEENFIFCNIPEENFPSLIGAFENFVAVSGTEIIKEGEPGDFFYVIEEGKIGFSIECKDAGSADAGRGFGGLALLYEKPRAATCVAKTDCSLWRLDQETFRHIQANYGAQESMDTKEHLRKVPFLKDLNEEYINRLAYSVTAETFLSGETIFKKGDPGDKFYVVRRGKVVCNDIEVGGEKFEDQIGGQHFGDRALITNEPRVANAVAIEDTKVYSISREVFVSMLGSWSDCVMRSNDLRMLKGIQIFWKSDMTDGEYDVLTNLIEDVTIPVGGEPIFSEGDTIFGALYIVRSGKVTVSSTKFDTKVITTGGYFGDTDILTPECKAERTAIVNEQCVLGKLTEKNIYSVLRNRKRLSMVRDNQEARKHVRYADVRKHKVCGSGTFGKVWLVSIENAAKPEAYALKIQRKRRLLDQNQVNGALREIKIMSKLDHPFIVKMLSAYQDDGSIMILQGFMQGGELFTLMRRCKNGIIGTNAARFYAAAILEGLIYMHNNNIIYRDMKPENIMIDADGFPVIVDFGFAKVVKDKTFTLCGTPYYIAPEVILGRGHDKACDYWSLAVLLHEMISGKTPFECNSSDDLVLFRAIVRGNYKMSRLVTSSPTDLMKKILVTQPSLRLGNLAGGGIDIKKHPFFQAVNYDKIIEKKVKVPWKPKPKEDPLDISNFTCPPIDSNEKEAPLTAEETKKFLGFDHLCTR